MIIEAFKITLTLLFVLFGPGFVLAFLMNKVAGSAETKACQIIGKKAYLWGFGWLGTVVHELSHAVMCVLFGHKIQKIVLFNPDPNSTSLGSVEHSHNPKNLYHMVGNFFIGIGPIIFGSGLIYVASILLLPRNFYHYAKDITVTHEVLINLEVAKNLALDIYEVFSDFLSQTFTAEVISNWQIYVFGYILFSIGSSMKLSGSDIKSAMNGFLIIFGLVFLLSLGLIYFELVDQIKNVFSLTVYLSAFYIAIIFALILNFLIILLFASIQTVKSIFT